MYLTFENHLGRLALYGGTAGEDWLSPPNTNWHIIGLNGLGMPQKTFHTVNYAGLPGQHTLGERAEARVITISGDLCCGMDPSTGAPLSLREQLREGIRVLNASGWLTVHTGWQAKEQRTIYARCTSFEPGARTGTFAPFVLQFTCDSPYFQDGHTTQVGVYSRTDLVQLPFVLPAEGIVCTARTTRTVVRNTGDLDTQPTFVCSALGNLISNDVTIYNHTTGQSLSLEGTPVQAGDVTIDLAAGRVYDQTGQNYSCYLSDGSYLSDFWLQTGDNDIEVLCAFPFAACHYTNQYLEAVI